MPKYNDTESKSTVVDTQKASYNKGTGKTAIQSVFPAHLKYVGSETSKLYEWFSGGSIVLVDDEDVPDLLAKRVGTKGCCGNNPDGNIVLAKLE